MVMGVWETMVGRTVAGVVRGEHHDNDIVYVCFDDGTAFEIYGRWFRGVKHLRFKSVRQAREEFERDGRAFIVDTAIAPPLDPRDIHGPQYIGIPDPEVVRMPPDRPEPGVSLVGWDAVAAVAPRAFDVWCGGADVAWAREAWDALGEAGLTGYRDGVGRAEVLVRFLALGEVYRDFCACAWEEHTRGSLLDLAGALGLSPFRLGQYLGAPFAAKGEEAEPSLEEALGVAVGRVRAGVVRALRAHHGSDDALFLWMWISNDPDRVGRSWEAMDDDELREVLNDPTPGRCAAYAWITDGMRPWR
jgi:hypothetical protein